MVTYSNKLSCKCHQVHLQFLQLMFGGMDQLYSTPLQMPSHCSHWQCYICIGWVTQTARISVTLLPSRYPLHSHYIVLVVYTESWYSQITTGICFNTGACHLMGTSGHAMASAGVKGICYWPAFTNTQTRWSQHWPKKAQDAANLPCLSLQLHILTYSLYFEDGY